MLGINYWRSERSRSQVMKIEEPHYLNYYVASVRIHAIYHVATHVNSRVYTL